MRTFTFAAKLPISIDKVWEAIGDIRSYPKRMKYIKNVKLHGEFEEGSTWEDRHTIMFLPFTTPHEIKKITHQKEVIYDLKFPLNGKMVQHVEIEGDKSKTNVNITVQYTLGSPFLNLTLGKVLEKRLNNLFRHTFADN